MVQKRKTIKDMEINPTTPRRVRNSGFIFTKAVPTIKTGPMVMIPIPVEVNNANLKSLRRIGLVSIQNKYNQICTFYHVDFTGWGKIEGKWNLGI